MIERPRSKPAAKAGRARRRVSSFPTPADTTPRRFDLSRAYIVRSLNATANKPLHLGHLRNAVLGAATASSLEALGARVLRHCVVEDAGRFMAEAMAAILERERADGVATTSPMKPDHFIGSCYADYRRRYATGDTTASIGYELRNDAADHLQFALKRGESDAVRAWRTVRTMAMEGQQATLQRVGLGFDCCDYESAEDASIDEFIVEGLEKGLFEYNRNVEVVYTASNGHEVRLINGGGLHEESARLLSFLRRLLRGWAGDRMNIIIAGSEWKSSMEIYPEILHHFGISQSYDIYAQAFYGMVLLNRKKMASSSGSGVLVDDLLDIVAGSHAIDELTQWSDGRVSRDGIAAMIVKAFLLSSARTEPIDFATERVLDPASNPGWTIARAWLSAPRAPRQASISENARTVIFDALSGISFEGAIRYTQEAAAHTNGADLPVLLRALALTPVTSDFTYARATPLALSMTDRP